MARGNRLHAVYDSGFVLRPDDPDTTPFEMKINSWLQLRHSVAFFAISADFRYQGWSLSTEYYFRSLTSISGAFVPDLFDHGFMMQSGYFIIPKKLELISRWSRIVGDSGTLGVRNQSADEVAGGVAWYIKGSNLKFVFDLSRVNGTPLNDSALGYSPGDDGLLYRTQFQFSF